MALVRGPRRTWRVARQRDDCSMALVCGLRGCSRLGGPAGTICNHLAALLPSHLGGPAGTICNHLAALLPCRVSPWQRPSLAARAGSTEATIRCIVTHHLQSSRCIVTIRCIVTQVASAAGGDSCSMEANHRFLLLLAHSHCILHRLAPRRNLPHTGAHLGARRSALALAQSAALVSDT